MSKGVLVQELAGWGQRGLGQASGLLTVKCPVLSLEGSWKRGWMWEPGGLGTGWGRRYEFGCHPQKDA